MASSDHVSTSTTSAEVGPADAELQAALAPAPTRPELALGFSRALDLGEGREPGHAARICYVALSLAHALELEPGDRHTTFFAALLHDAGAAPASAETCRLLGLAEERIFCAPPGKSAQQIALEIAPSDTADVVETLRAHVTCGARAARDLNLDEDVQRGIEAHHERWNGHGYPHATKGEEIPIAARLIAAADLIESLISSEVNPLAARRSLLGMLAEEAGKMLDPAIADRAMQLIRSDAFWLGLHDDDLTQVLVSWCPDEPVEGSRSDLDTFAKVFADLADAKGEHTSDHGERSADVAAWLADQAGLDEEHRAQLRIAAVVHNVGLLGVPARVIAKPDILSLSEMETMRRHPSFSQMVLEKLPGLDELASWIGAHHERPDGRGYPEALDDETIPIEARILAVADTYVALTSTRPYRAALSHEDAAQVLIGGAGTQLDPKLVQLLCTRWPEATSARTARR